MTGVVIRCVGRPEGGLAPVGLYLRSYDPDAFEGRGMADWTLHLGAALVFPDAAAAQECYVGPLTAYDVEFVSLDG